MSNRFKSFVEKYYTWTPRAGYELDPNLDDNTQFYSEMRRGKITLPDIISYATLVDELLPKIQTDASGAGTGPEMRAGRQAYGRTAELDYQVRAGDTKEVVFTKNGMFQRMACFAKHVVER